MTTDEADKPPDPVRQRCCTIYLQIITKHPPACARARRGAQSHDPAGVEVRFRRDLSTSPRPRSDHRATNDTMHGRTGPPRGGLPRHPTATGRGCNRVRWRDVRGRGRHELEREWHASETRRTIDYRRTRRCRKRDLLAGIEAGVADRCGVCVRRLSTSLRSLRLGVVGERPRGL